MNELRKIGIAEFHLDVLGADMRGDLAGPACLVVGGVLGKRDRERLQWRARLRGREDGDEGGVPAAAEKDPHGHIRGEVAPDRGAQAALEVAGGVLRLGRRAVPAAPEESTLNAGVFGNEV